MNRNDLFRLLKEAVKYSPTVTTGSNQLRLETFAVVRSAGEAISESLGKTVWDRDKNFFYSRKWEALNYSANNIAHEYPLLIAYDLSPRLTNFFQSKGHRIRQIRLDCLYPNIEKLDQNVKLQCKKLHVQEIYDVTEAMLIQVLSYINNIVYANVDGTPGYHNQSRLDQQVSDGDVTAYTIDTNATNTLKRQLKDQNETMSGGYIDDQSVNALCGVHYTFSLVESACEVQDSNFNVINCCQ